MPFHARYPNFAVSTLVTQDVETALKQGRNRGFNVLSTVFCQKGLSAISKTFQEAEKTDFRQHMAL